MPLLLTNLKAEGLTQPVGLECRLPHFSWELVSDRREVYQRTARLEVHAEDAPIWDSGPLESGQSVCVPYGGPALLPLTRYTWHVSVTDNHGESARAWSTLETGRMDIPWTARWAEPEQESAQKTPQLSHQQQQEEAAKRAAAPLEQIGRAHV